MEKNYPPENLLVANKLTGIPAYSLDIVFPVITEDARTVFKSNKMADTRRKSVIFCDVVKLGVTCDR